MAKGSGPQAARSIQPNGLSVWASARENREWSMSYQRSVLRSVAIAVVALPLLGVGLSLLAPAQDASSGGIVTMARAASLNTHDAYGLPPSQPQEFTLTSDGQ